MLESSASLADQGPSEPPLEIELKLSLPPALVPKIWKMAPISTLLTGRPLRRHVFSAYYDTPQMELHQRDIALRLRRQGRHWVQTLKTRGMEAGALQRRVELEVPVNDGVLDVDWLKCLDLEGITGGKLPTTALGIMFTTEFERRLALVEPAAGSSIEVCVDEGAIVAGRRRLPICELELELKKGELAPLFDLARQLAAVPGVHIETASKAQRGYKLATGSRSAPVKAHAVSLPSPAGVDSLFTTLAFSCMGQLQENEHGVQHSRDIEYLHQARVALRRLRSVFSIFSGAVPQSLFSGQLEWLHTLGRLLGEARDWDVFVADFLPTACSRIEDGAALAGVIKNTMRLRAAARRRVRDAMESTDYNVQMLLLTQNLHERKWDTQRSIEQREVADLPAKAFAASILARTHHKVVEQGKRMDWSSNADLHKLRIRIKKLRYSSELLSPLFKQKDVRKFLSKLSGMQDMLGMLNDAATAARLVGQIDPDRTIRENAEIIGYLTGYAHAQMYFSLADFRSAWKQFRIANIFW